jgi:alkylation response protein AidB-like acyl-CoA dehydrogenase
VDNPLISDRQVDFLLYEVLDVPRLCALPAFAEHGRETFDLFLGGARRLAREQLFPSYRAIDAAPPELRDGRVYVHPKLRELFAQLVAMGLTSATRPAAVGGQQLPMTVAALASAYLMAGNLSAYGYVGLTSAAAHLLEAFGDETLRRELMEPLYAGKWTGTMALSEPQAGSSLADVTTRATPTGDGDYRVRGAKIFISAGDHDLTENVVHLALGRIDGAPAGIKGVSLFAIPRRRLVDGALADNDVHITGLVHKIGWRGLPSLILSFGERGDCRGRLVGEPNRGITYMFQMMNEARIMVGMNGIATASVAYHESLGYAQERTQGRAATARDPGKPQVPIIEHADVRRMLLRQKAIVEGGLALLATTALQADLAAHAADEAVQKRAQGLLDLLTPLAKSFGAEWGFESNALALQIHGGYGYSSEYLPEAWLRDQKLNSIHEGTTGIQGLDLLGRKVVADGGRALLWFADEVRATVARADAAGVEGGAALGRALGRLTALTATLGARGGSGDVEGMLRHSHDYLTLFCIIAVAWQWLAMAAVAAEALAAGRGPRAFYEGKRAAARYWLGTELPRVEALATLCADNEPSYAEMTPDQF